MPRYVRSTRLPVAREQAFAWHDRPGALHRLTPPFLPARVERSDDSLEVGSEVALRLGPSPLALRWLARHVVYDPPARFEDEQVSGPFAAWHHRHRFEAEGTSTCVLVDDVTYRLRLPGLAEAVAGPAVRRQLDRLFRFRHTRTQADLTVHAAARRKGVEPMHVAVTGSGGLIGRELTAFLSAGGHRVTRLVRHPPREAEIAWDPERGEIDAEGLRGVDAVVHLAGEPIVGRWSRERKRRIRDSRIKGTRLLAETLAALEDGPKVLVSASGINYYPEAGDEALTEESGPGDGFLAQVCSQWEAATEPAAAAGVRVVMVRTGIVQTPEDGALARQLPLFRLGLGGRLGSGRQWVSWVSLDDVVGIYHHALVDGSVRGPVNATAPAPVTNATYTRVLASVLGRPAPFPVPKIGPRLVFGEMADVLVFASPRVLPSRLRGYTFRHPDLETCLRDVLGRWPPADLDDDGAPS